MPDSASANVNRQNKLFWGTFVKAIGKENCYEVIKSETKSYSWSKLSEAKRDLVLKALSEKTGIDLTPKSQVKPDKAEAPANVVQFPRQKTTRATKGPDTLSDLQLTTIRKLQRFCHWTDDRLDGYSITRFGKPPASIEARQGHSLIYQLLRIAAYAMRKEDAGLNDTSINELIDAVKDTLEIRGYGKQRAS